MDYSELIYKKKILNFILILIPIFLITGPFLTDLSISILAISFIFIKSKEKYLKNYFFIFFLLFYVTLLISSSFAEYKDLAFRSSFFYFRFGLYTLFFWYLIDLNNNILRGLFVILFCCFLILIFDSFYQYIFGKNIFNMKILKPNRVSSFFGDELKMGSYLMRLSPLLLSLTFLFYNKTKHQKFLPLAIFFILLIQSTIYLSGERTSFFLFNFSLILYLIFLNNFKLVKFTFLFFSILLTIFLLNTETPFKKRLIDLTVKNTKIFDKNSKKVIFSQKYNEHYISAWRMFQDNKIIGIGPKNFREVCKKDEYNISVKTCSTHPHNIMLQFLSETGLTGFVFYLIMNFLFWFLLFKSLFYKLFFNKNIYKNSQICLFIYFTLIFWPLAPYGNFFNNWLSAVTYLPAAILLWMFDKKIKFNFRKFNRT